MTWNYRLIKHEDKGSEWFAIHEVYYENEKPVSCSVEPAEIVSDEEDGAIWILDKMKECLNKPILEFRDF
jgi:hypothetical protein